MDSRPSRCLFYFYPPLTSLFLFCRKKRKLVVTITITITPIEEKFNKDVGFVLHKIKEQSLYATKDNPVVYHIDLLSMASNPLPEREGPYRMSRSLLAASWTILVASSNNQLSFSLLLN